MNMMSYTATVVSDVGADFWLGSSYGLSVLTIAICIIACLLGILGIFIIAGNIFEDFLEFRFEFLNGAMPGTTAIFGSAFLFTALAPLVTAYETVPDTSLKVVVHVDKAIESSFGESAIYDGVYQLEENDEGETEKVEVSDYKLEDYDTETREFHGMIDIIDVNNQEFATYEIRVPADDGSVRFEEAVSIDNGDENNGNADDN